MTFKYYQCEIWLLLSPIKDHHNQMQQYFVTASIVQGHWMSILEIVVTLCVLVPKFIMAMHRTTSETFTRFWRHPSWFKTPKFSGVSLTFGPTSRLAIPSCIYHAYIFLSGCKLRCFAATMRMTRCANKYSGKLITKKPRFLSSFRMTRMMTRYCQILKRSLLKMYCQ